MKRIVVDPRVMSGKPAISGTRITVDLIPELLASGMTPEEVAEDHRISVEDVGAALLYAAKIIGREEIPVVEARAGLLLDENGVQESMGSSRAEDTMYKQSSRNLVMCQTRRYSEQPLNTTK